MGTFSRAPVIDVLQIFDSKCLAERRGFNSASNLSITYADFPST